MYIFLKNKTIIYLKKINTGGEEEDVIILVMMMELKCKHQRCLLGVANLWCCLGVANATPMLFVC